MADVDLASVTALISVLTLAWTVAAFALTRRRLSAFETRTLQLQREFAARDHHWHELTGAIDYALGKTRSSKAIGLTILRRLPAADWASNDDRLKVAEVLAAIQEEE